MSRASSKRKKIQQRAKYSSSSLSYNNNEMQALLAQVQAKMQRPGDVLYGPGIPLQPQIGVNPDGQPRQWSFPIAINTSGVDRAYGNPDIPSFKQLRMLSKLYSGITLPERVWLDMIHGLHLNVTLKPELKAQGMDDKDPDIQKSISNILTFFECPDKTHDHHSWLKMMVRDQTQVDEMYLYKRRARDGSLYALEVTAGDTIKPLLDDWGRIPEPPLYAYQQFPWGIPGDQYTTEDLIHYQETPQTDSAYGFGRVERFMMEVNQALRKKKRDLSMFTEGNIPAGIMEVPESANWTPDQIDAYEQLWNALIAGNVQQQVRVKFTQPGMKYVPTDKGDILTDFDYFLYKISCGVYGISLADIGFVEDIHKSSDQGQQNMMYRRTLKPIVTTYAQIITRIIREEFHEDRLEASYGGYEEEDDFNTQAEGFQILANIGAIAPSDIAHLMKLPDVPKTGPFLMTKTGPFFLKDYEEGSDLRTAQTQATMAGMQLAANPQPDEEDSENDDSSQQSQESKASTGPGKNGKPGSNDKVEEGKSEGKKEAPPDDSEKPATKDNNLKRAVESDLPQTGMMIAFMLDPETAQQLALEGSEDPDDMHVTLAYLGDMSDERPGYQNPAIARDTIQTVLKSFAQSTEPLSGNVGGLGRFMPSDSSDGMSPVIGLVNVPGLQDWRRRLVDVVETAGFWVANNFDYTPHITLSYIDSDAPMPVHSIENVPLKFDALCLAIGDDRQYFTLGQESSVNTQEWEGGYGNELVQRGDTSIRREDPGSEASELRDGGQGDNSGKRAELRRWRTRALHDIERSRAIRPFESDILTLAERTHIGIALERASSPEQVREIFRAASTDESYNWQKHEPEIQKSLADMRNKGVKKLKWIQHSNECDICSQNNGRVVETGELFPSLVYMPPGHPNCICDIEEIYE